MAYGRFGQVYLASLEANRPEEFNRLKARGQLSVQCAQEDERGNRVFQTALADLRRKYPEPEDYPSRVQHLQNLESQATELAIEEVTVRPEPEAGEVNASPASSESEDTTTY